jgi:hypothetical protein
MLNLLVISGNYWVPDCDELVTGIEYRNIEQKKIKYTINNNVLQVSLPEPDMQIRIINLNGKIIQTKVCKTNLATINISALNKGCYILKLENNKNNGFISERFIVR